MKGKIVLSIFVGLLLLTSFAGAVVINEYLPDPDTIYSTEWIEIYNDDLTAVDLSGWTLNDSLSKPKVIATIPSDMILAAGAYLTITVSDLNNDADSILLIDTLGNVVDEASWTSNPGNDKSWARIHDGSEIWDVMDEPTPGALNNRIPTGTPPTQSIVEGIESSFDANGYVTDADGDNLTYTVVNENTEEVDCNVSGSTVTMLATDWDGTASCTLEVNDGYSTVQKTFTIDVEAANQAPIISPFTITFDEDDSDIINLSEEVTDDNDNPEDITWSVVTHQGLIASIDGEMLTISAEPDYNGEANITLTATDLDGLSDTKDILVTVNPLNDPPYIMLQYIEFDEDTNATINLSKYAVDIDNNVSYISWSYYGNGSNLSISIENDMMTIQPDENYYGERVITLIADDSQNATEKNTTIYVDPVNDIPVIEPIGPMEFFEEGYDTLDLNDYVSDVESDDEDIEWSVGGDTSNLIIHIDEETHVLNVSADKDWFGERTITLTATDEDEGTASVDVDITVTNDNDAPIFTTAAPIAPATEGIEYTYDADASDIDNNASDLTFSVVSGPGEINGETGVYTYTPTGADVGKQTVILGVSDDEYTAELEFNLTVQPVLDIVDITINGESVKDGDTLNGFAPGATINVAYKILNRNIVDTDLFLLVAVTSEAEINAYSLSNSTDEFILRAQEVENVQFEFQLPYTAKVQYFALDLNAAALDFYEGDHSSSKSINLVLDRDLRRVEITKMEWARPSVSCFRDDQLKVTVVDTGNFSESGTVNIYNDATGKDETQPFSLDIAQEATLSFDVDATNAEDNGVFDITLKYFHNVYTVTDSIQLNVVNCFDQSALESEAVMNEDMESVWDIGLADYVAEDGLQYEVVSTNSSILNCSVEPDGSNFMCDKPLGDWYGTIPVNMTLTKDDASLVYQFTVAVEPVDDAPIAEDINVSVDEDSSAAIELMCTDIDSEVLTYAVVDEPQDGELSGTDKILTYSPAPNYNGNDYFTYKCSDGEKDSNAATVDILVNSVPDYPAIIDHNPKGDILIGDNVKQAFNVTIGESDVDYVISWYVNGVYADEGEQFDFEEGQGGMYTLAANVTNEDNTESYDKAEWSVEVSDVPVTNDYTGTIEDVNPGNVDEFTGLTILKDGVGVIDFGDEEINLENIVDVDTNVLITQGIAGINTETEGFEVFKIYATITMYGVDSPLTPKVYYNSDFSTTGPFVECTSSTNPKCDIISYNQTTQTLVFNVSHFTLFSLTLPVAPTADAGNSRSVSVNTAVTLDGSGSTDQDGNIVSYNWEEISGLNVTLTNADSKIAKFTPTQTGTYEFRLTVVDNDGLSATDEVVISVEEAPPSPPASESVNLTISSLDVKVGDKTEKDLENGDDIGRDAKPGDLLKFDVELENLFPSSSDIQIENIELTITIKDIDDGDDLEDSVDYDDLDAGDDDSQVIEFTLPTLVEEDTYDVILEVDAEDENGGSQDFSWELQLDVKKDSHALLLDRATISPSEVSCNRDATLSLRVVNIGREDEDEVRLEVQNSELGIGIDEDNIEIEEGSDEDSVYETSYNFNLENAKPGIYPISVKAYYDSKLGDEQTLTLTVEDCVVQSQVSTPLASEPVELITTPAVTKQAPVTEISFTNTSTYAIMLLGLFFVLLVAVIFLAGAIILGMRKR
jgi:hypothetical protein